MCWIPKGLHLTQRIRFNQLLNSNVSEGDTISIKRAVSVELTLGDKVTKIDIAEDTIGDMLKVRRRTRRTRNRV